MLAERTMRYWASLSLLWRKHRFWFPKTIFGRTFAGGISTSRPISRENLIVIVASFEELAASIYGAPLTDISGK